MGDEVRLMIADADEEYQLMMADRIADSSGLRLTGCASTADQALELLRTCEADALLLDLILPGRDGIYVLEKLRELPRPPAVVVNTSFHSALLDSRCAGLKVSALLVKPCEPEFVLERVRSALAFNRENAPAHFHHQPQPGNGTEPEEQIRWRLVTELLQSLYCSVHYKGYEYLRHAVLVAWRSGRIDRNVTKLIYPETARFFGVSSGGVERGIRTVAEHMWKDGGARAFQDVLGITLPERGLTNTELISLLVEYLKAHDMDDRCG